MTFLQQNSFFDFRQEIIDASDPDDPSVFKKQSRALCSALLKKPEVAFGDPSLLGRAILPGVRFQQGLFLDGLAQNRLMDWEILRPHVVATSEVRGLITLFETLGEEKTIVEAISFVFEFQKEEKE